MAIFRERQDVHGDPEAEKIVRGILALNGDQMVLDQDTIYNLIGEEESWEDVISPEKALKKCYIFSEAAIRSNMFFVENEDEKVKKMLLLRQKSLLPAHLLILPDRFSLFPAALAWPPRSTEI